MENEEITQKTIRSFLIGDLDEVAADALDERSIADQGFADRIAAEQYDLVDEWVDGRLDASDAKAFGQVLARSPSLAEKVKISKAMMTAAPRAAVVERSSEATFFQKIFGSIPKLAYGLAGVLLLSAVAATVFFVRKDKVNEISRVELPINGYGSDVSISPTPVVTPTEGPSTRESVSPTVNAPGLANSNAKKPTPEPARTALRSFVALTLSPPTRGAGDVRSVKIDQGVEYLELNVQTESETTGRFVIEAADWRSSPVRGRGQKGVTVVSVRVPAERLKNGLVTILLRDAASGSEIVDEHVILIER
ncbi:MAG: hypothetical protein ABIR33_10265 [Pyrinomonadaceae bacterium]